MYVCTVMVEREPPFQQQILCTIADELPLPRPKKVILASLKNAISDYIYGSVFTIIELSKITDMEVHLYDFEDIICIRDKYYEIIGGEALQRMKIYVDTYTDKIRAEHAHCLYKKDLNKVIKRHSQPCNGWMGKLLCISAPCQH